jgi:hypothetical protein
MTERIRSRVDRLELPWNAYGCDPYGISKEDLVWFFDTATFLYRNYFRVRSAGIEHVPARGRAMLVGNHSGGIALDALIVVTAMFLEKEPPRLAQGMADKFLARTPFASRILSRLGHLTGLPEHVARMLRDERLLLVFPEEHGNGQALESQLARAVRHWFHAPGAGIGPHRPFDSWEGERPSDHQLYKPDASSACLKAAHAVGSTASSSCATRRIRTTDEVSRRRYEDDATIEEKVAQVKQLSSISWQTDRGALTSREYSFLARRSACDKSSASSSGMDTGRGGSTPALGPMLPGVTSTSSTCASEPPRTCHTAGGGHPHGDRHAPA